MGRRCGGTPATPPSPGSRPLPYLIPPSHHHLSPHTHTQAAILDHTGKRVDNLNVYMDSTRYQRTRSHYDPNAISVQVRKSVGGIREYQPNLPNTPPPHTHTRANIPSSKPFPRPHICSPPPSQQVNGSKQAWALAGDLPTSVAADLDRYNTDKARLKQVWGVCVGGVTGSYWGLLAGGVGGSTMLSWRGAPLIRSSCSGLIGVWGAEGRWGGGHQPAAAYQVCACRPSLCPPFP